MSNIEWKIGDWAVFLSPETYPRVGAVIAIDDETLRIEDGSGRQWCWAKYRFYKPEYLLQLVQADIDNIVELVSIVEDIKTYFRIPDTKT